MVLRKTDSCVLRAFYLVFSCAKMITHNLMTCLVGYFLVRTAYIVINRRLFGLYKAGQSLKAKKLCMFLCTVSSVFFIARCEDYVRISAFSVHVRSYFCTFWQTKVFYYISAFCKENAFLIKFINELRFPWIRKLVHTCDVDNPGHKYLPGLRHVHHAMHKLMSLNVVELSHMADDI